MAKDKNKEKPADSGLNEELKDGAQEQCSQGAQSEAEPQNEQAASKEQELQKKLDEVNDKLLRTVAEYDNFRKRSQKEKEAIFSDSKAEIVGKILPVIDNFERAAAAEGDFENYKKGIVMTVKQLLDTMASLGVQPFGEPGESFDPNIHNGVMHVEDAGLEENVIAEVFMKGYKIGDRVVRHATVKVAN